MHHLVESIKVRGPLLLIYLANLFLSFHYFTTVYVNSSFLGDHISDHQISALYVIASTLNIVIFLYIATFLRAFGNYKLTLIFALLDALAVFGLAYVTDLALILPLFVLHQALIPMILFNLDIFLEHSIKNENTTGGVRGMFLTVSNLALVISPLLLTYLSIKNNDFSEAYLLSGLFLIPVILIIGIAMREFKDRPYHPFNLAYELNTFLKNKDIGSVFGANFLLQFFYTFMVIYMPIYLTAVVGFTWQEFSLMLSIALLPFLLFELPVGALADRKYGEKEMMLAGFAIISLSLMILSSINGANFWLYAATLFLTRTGAALVEITSESYFFKKIHEVDADLVGIFRISRPVSFLFGPLLGGLALYFGGYKIMFMILALIMIMGIVFVSRITDTR